MTAQKTIGVCVKAGVARDDALVERVISVAEATGARVVVHLQEGMDHRLERARTAAWTEPLDLLLVVGGDGTMLRAVRELDALTVPVLGVNHGGLGFLTAIDAADVDSSLPGMLAGEALAERHRLLLVRIRHANGKTAVYRALNDAAVTQGPPARLLRLELAVDGEPLTLLRADGLIVSSPTGSTAYALAAGGSAIDPCLSGYAVTPLHPINPQHRPFLLAAERQLEATIATRPDVTEPAVALTIDGQLYAPLAAGDTVSFHLGEEAATLLRRPGTSFVSRLRGKLSW